jgi:hypothetical protein
VQVLLHVRGLYIFFQQHVVSIEICTFTFYFVCRLSLIVFDSNIGNYNHNNCHLFFFYEHTHKNHTVLILMNHNLAFTYTV